MGDEWESDREYKTIRKTMLWLVFDIFTAFTTLLQYIAILTIKCGIR